MRDLFLLFWVGVLFAFDGYKVIHSRPLAKCYGLYGRTIGQVSRTVFYAAP